MVARPLLGMSPGAVLCEQSTLGKQHVIFLKYTWYFFPAAWKSPKTWYICSKKPVFYKSFYRCTVGGGIIVGRVGSTEYIPSRTSDHYTHVIKNWFLFFFHKSYKNNANFVSLNKDVIVLSTSAKSAMLVSTYPMGFIKLSRRSNAHMHYARNILL